MICLGNAARADRIRRGTKAIEKKYAVVESIREAPSATLSTKPSFSPYLQSLQRPQDTPVRTKESEIELRENYSKNKTADKYKNSTIVAIDESLDKVEAGITPSMEAVSPLDSRKIEELGLSPSLSPVVFEDLERCSIDSPEQISTMNCN